MRSQFNLLALTLLAPFAQAESSPEVSIFFELHSISFSQPTAINSLLNQFNGDYQAGEYAFSESFFETGWRRNNTALSLVARDEHFYGFSEDLAQFYYEDQNSRAHAKQQYAVSLQANEFTGTGIKLSQQWPVTASLQIGVAGSWLRAKKSIDGMISGDLASVDSLNFSGDVLVNVHSTTDVILDKHVDDPEGQGYSLDVTVMWQVNEQWHIAMELMDVVSKIHWQDSLDTSLSLANGKSPVVDGKLTVLPLLQGRQSVGDYKQQLIAKHHLNINYQPTAVVSAYLSVYTTKYFSHSTLGLSTSKYLNSQLEINWTPQTGAIGFGFYHDIFDISLSSDRLSLKKNHALQFSAGFRILL